MPFASKEISRFLRLAAFVCGAVAATAVSGCQTLEKMERENYQRACDKLGIKSGTPTYDECRLKQQRMDNDDIERLLDRSTEERILQKPYTNFVFARCAEVIS